MSLIPAACLDALPLSPESISRWSTDGDLLVFLRNLHDWTTEAANGSGQRFPVNYRSYGDTQYEQGKSSFREIASEFQRQAENHRDTAIPYGPIRIYEPIDCLEDTTFGLLAKHAIAWDAVVEALLSDDGFFSLPIILEARTELDCSVLLAKHLYYKQALQVLRGLLELNVLHVHFAGDERDYAAWQVGNYRVPNLRGDQPERQGLLRRLLQKGAIAQDVKDESGLAPWP